ncbi:MAG: Arginine--tRNA ligase [Candidatus Methanofastidiosum methylothiophilum]|uniref:Arginine--tRNA ligase n=1 Tax=Candidatus Methanofastidiosum methylothiophilum TaxID=1705564 RepID=A0A150IID6_9EURY|nr:MAG: Arginine--tRNA ligase [Candidatus Methanofastidiosum methylthiophilus]
MLKNLKKELENSIRKAVDSEQDYEIVFSRPPDFKLGDIATPLSFELAKKLKKNPILIAKNIAENIVLPEGIERAETSGGYINFFFDRIYFSKKTVEIIIGEATFTEKVKKRKRR